MPARLSLFSANYYLQRLLEENSGLLGKGKGKGKGKQRETFEAVHNGDFVFELSEDEFQYRKCRRYVGTRC